MMGATPPYEWISNNYLNFWLKFTLGGLDKKINGMACNRTLSNQYRIYRNGDLIAEIPYTFQTYFTDTEFTKGIDVEYCVTAVYGDEESEPVCATANITGVGEASTAYGITIAPNPTSGQLTVMGKELRRAEVVNMLGQHIISVNGTGDELQIDMADLPSGVYFIEIADAEGKRCVKKVMKGSSAML